MAWIMFIVCVQTWIQMVLFLSWTIWSEWLYWCWYSVKLFMFLRRTPRPRCQVPHAQPGPRCQWVLFSFSQICIKFLSNNLYIHIHYQYPKSQTFLTRIRRVLSALTQFNQKRWGEGKLERLCLICDPANTLIWKIDIYSFLYEKGEADIFTGFSNRLLLLSPSFESSIQMSMDLCVHECTHKHTLSPHDPPLI